MSVVLILAVLLGAAPPSKDAAKKEDGATKKEDDAPVARAIDPTYSLQLGDQVWVDTGSKDKDGEPFAVVGAPSIPEFVTYTELSSSGNEAALDKLEAAKKIMHLDAGAQVLVTGLRPVQPGLVVAEVKVLDGEFKGKVLYVDPREVVRYVTVPNQPGMKKKSSKPPKKKQESPASTKPAADPSARAVTLLRMGQNLEKADKTSGAIENYQKLVKEFPTTPQAKVAQGRLKALQNK